MVGNEIPFMGYDSVICVGQQVTTATYVTGSAYLEFNSESMKREIQEQKLTSLHAGRHYTKRVQTNEVIGGSIDFDLNIASDACVYFLKNAMGGTCSTAVLSAAVSFGHTFYPGDWTGVGSAGSVLRPYLSLGVRKGNENTWQFSACRVNTLTIKGEIGQPIRCTAEIVGQSATTHTSIGAGTISYSAVRPLMFDDVSIFTGVSIGAASTTEAFTSFELTIANNLDSDCRMLGSRNIQKIPPGMCDVKLKLGCKYDTQTSFNRFIGNTMTAFAIKIQSPVSIPTSEVKFYTLRIDIPAGYVNTAMPEVGGPEALKYDFEVTGIYNASASAAVKFYIINGTTAYDS